LLSKAKDNPSIFDPDIIGFEAVAEDFRYAIRKLLQKPRISFIAAFAF
jgi:hypothetical protein